MPAKGVTSALGALLTGIMNLFYRGVGRGLRRFVIGIESIISKITEAFAWSFTGIFLLELISLTMSRGSPVIASALAPLLSAQTGGKVSPERIIGKEGIAQFAEISQGVGAFIFESMLDVFDVEGPITPQVGRANAQKFIGLNVLINVSSWATRLIADTLSLGKFESIGGLPLQISWALGLGWLTWVVMGPPLKLLIADPLEEGFNRKYLPNRLTLSQVLDIFTEGLKDKEWFQDKMQALGFDEDTAFLLWEGRRKKFSRTQLKRFFERGLIDEDQLREFLKREGWTEEELDLIVEEFMNERIFDLGEDIAKEAIFLFQEGQINESLARSYLRRFHWTPQEIDLAIELANLRKLRTDLTTTQLLNLMGDGFLTQAQVQQRLIDKGFSASDAQLLIQQEILSRKPKVKPPKPPEEITLTQAQILAAFRQGVINEAEARKRLEEKRLKKEDIDILISLNRPTT
jgi:hypothetical protein